MTTDAVETADNLSTRVDQKLLAQEICTAQTGRASTLEQLFPGDTLRQYYESQVRQIELEMQNDELRQSRNDLESGRNRYIKLYADTYHFDYSRYFSFDALGMVRKADLTDAQLREIERILTVENSTVTLSAGSVAREVISKLLTDDAQRLETEVQDAREYAENIVETVREPLLVLNEELQILTANQSFYRTFRVTAEQTIGEYIYDVGNRQWDIPKLRVLIEDILPHNTVFNDYEVEHNFPGIGHKFILLNARQIFRKNIGSHIILLAMEDITERKQVETELKNKSAEIEQFMYSVSHDLRSPLVTIKTFMGYLAKDMSESNQEHLAQDIGFIHAAADKMKLLLDELLEMSRIGRVEAPKVRVPFREILDGTLGMLAGIISQRQIDIHLPESDLMLSGDPQRLHQIWQNLIENAIKYSAAGIVPRIELGLRQENGDTVFFVRDDGIGIDSRYLGKVFGIFEKLDPKSPGAGLGLCMVQRIVEKNGGRIWVESDGEGTGSCFYFTLPDAVVA